MTSYNATPHTYRQKPTLHSNLIIASLQLLIWITFFPSAWCSYLAQIDPSLHPDCTLADMSRNHWRSPLLRQLLRSYCFYLPLTLIVSLVMLWAFDLRDQNALVGVLASLMISVFYFVLVGTWISIAVGIVLSVPGSIMFCLAYALTKGWGYPELIPSNSPWFNEVIYGAVIGLAGGVGGSIVSHISSGRLNYSRSKWSTWISGTGTGILLAAIASFSMHSILRFLVTITFERDLPGGSAQNLPLALALALFLILVFVAIVGWERARTVLAIIGCMLLGIFVSFALFAHLDLYSATTIGFTIAFIGLIGVPYRVVERITNPQIGASVTAFGLGVGWIIWMITAYNWHFWSVFLPTLICLAIGSTLFWWEALIIHPFLEVWDLLVYRLDEGRSADKPSFLHWHAAFWNETHRLPLRSLEEYLLLIAERNPAEGQFAIDYLSESRYQRSIAQEVQIELYARRLEKVDTIESIASVSQSLTTGDLESPVSAILRSLSRTGQTINAAINSATTYHKRLALNAVEESLDVLLREMTLSNDPYTSRFRPVAIRWREIIADYVQNLTIAVERNQEIENPYIFSLPLAEHQDLFVGRADIAARIEQLIVDRRRPPFLLYGQRRMGKTSLLRNLGRLLPSSTVLLFVDGEGVAGASDYGDFLYAVAMAMVKSADEYRHMVFPLPNRANMAASPFTAFNEWLDQVEKALAQAKSVALLALDEFEALDNIRDDRFNSQDFLRLLRSLMQHRRLFKVLLAGSHTLEEFRHWASYLINLQVVKISYLEEKDVLELIENPVKEFAVLYETAASRYILDLTHGHPHLVQLLCYEIIELKNRQPFEQRLLVTVDDVEAAVPRALITSDFFFADLSNQVGADGLAVLRFLADQGQDAVVSRAVLCQQCTTDADQVFNLLLRRDVIEMVDGGYRFQVELMRRWFAQLGATALVS